MKKPLDIAIVINDFNIYYWQYCILEKLLDSEYCRIQNIILDQQDKNYKLQKSLLPKNNFLLSALWLIDNVVFKKKVDALKQVSIHGLPNLEAEPITINQYIDTKKNDVFIDFRTKANIDIPYQDAQFGIWKINHGHFYHNKNSSPCIEDTLCQIPETPSFLTVKVKETDHPVVLLQTSVLTHAISVNKNLNHSLFQSVAMIPKELKNIYETDGLGWTDKTSKNRAADFRYESECKSMNGFKVVWLVFSLYLNYLYRKIWKLFFREDWILLYSFDKKHDDIFFVDLEKTNQLVPPKNKFWGDPFVILRDNKYHLFFEEYDYSKRKGYIMHSEFNGEGKILSPVIILEKNYHLSYPFIFEYDKDLYMIPESSGNHTIDLYKCTCFPDSWEYEKTLMNNIKAADTTLYYYDETWWMFTNIKSSEGLKNNYTDLYIFYTKNPLEDDWNPHPLNPVVSDVKSSRPAGNVFKKEGVLYRPSQDCSKRYGYGLNINRIAILNKNEYREVLTKKITPSKGSAYRGIHTCNFARDLILSDASIVRSRF